MPILYYAYLNLDKEDSLRVWADKIIEEYPSDGEIIASYASHLNSTNRAERAMRLARSYLQHDSINVFVKRQYGHACYLAGNYDEAITIYNNLRQQGLDNHESNFVLGVSYQEKARLDETYHALQKAAELKQLSDYPSLFQLGRVANKLFLRNEAIEALEKAARVLLPDSDRMFFIYNELGEAHFYLKQYDRALSAFEKCVQYRPNHALTYYNIAQMYNGLKNADQVLFYYQKFINKSNYLEDTVVNRQLIDNVRKFLRRYAPKSM